MSKTKDLTDLSQDIFMPLFPPQPIIPDYGQGMYIYDLDNKKYLDFAAGIAVNSLGHAHPAYLKTAQEQLAKLNHVPGTYLTEPKVKCAELLVKNGCFDQVFFSNSGTEAIEGCIKLARKWAYETNGPECNEIIAFEGAFHGRTMGAASLTNKRTIQPFFGPYMDGVQFAKFNDIESVRALINKNTAAIIVEPVQGEGGIIPAESDFFTQLRAMCYDHNIALVFDEIQAGIGRLGTFFAYQTFGVEPDIAALAKGLGNGFPIGAIVAKKEFGDHFTPGSHGSTYGGNPLGTALSHCTISEILKDGFMENVRKTGQYIMDHLRDIQDRTDSITDVRGIGFMIGIDTVFDIAALRAKAQEYGLITTQSGAKTLRLTPPLIAEEKHADEALGILEKIMKEGV